VIIVTWNKKNYVIDLLRSLEALNYAHDRLDVLVVDNASSDGTVEALKADFPAIQLLENKENLGGTGGFNTGLQWAAGQPPDAYDYLWLLDNDVQVHQDALLELVAILDTHKDVAVAGSTMMQLDFPWRINEMGAYVDRGCGRLLFNQHLQEIPSLQGRPVAALTALSIVIASRFLHSGFVRVKLMELGPRWSKKKGQETQSRAVSIGNGRHHPNLP